MFTTDKPSIQRNDLYYVSIFIPAANSLEVKQAEQEAVRQRAVVVSEAISHYMRVQRNFGPGNNNFLRFSSYLV
jgi:hypothetical protein